MEKNGSYKLVLAAISKCKTTPIFTRKENDEVVNLSNSEDSNEILFKEENDKRQF